MRSAAISVRLGTPRGACPLPHWPKRDLLAGGLLNGSCACARFAAGPFRKVSGRSAPVRESFPHGVLVDTSIREGWAFVMDLFRRAGIGPAYSWASRASAPTAEADTLAPRFFAIL